MGKDFIKFIINFILLGMGAGGIEPPSTGPKPDILSIKLRAPIVFWVVVFMSEFTSHFKLRAPSVFFQRNKSFKT
jgi:hypothetical protein